MSGTTPDSQANRDLGLKLAYWLTVAMVIIGLINMTPGIPGYDDLAESLTGAKGATFRKFPFEWFYPSFFALMMLIVALKHSMWRSWAEASRWRRRFGLFMDVALVLMAVTISGTYFVEIEAICLIDQITGDRARLIEESLKAERELAELLGMEPPTTIDDPKCVNTTGGYRWSRDRRLPVLQSQGLGSAARTGGNPDRDLYHPYRPCLVFPRSGRHQQISDDKACRRAADAGRRAATRA